MNYRFDIQGLRAVAIIGVVLFHLNPQWLPGGFVGVDIFFVISGFLITGLLIQSHAKGYSLLNFYKRRIARLFPAYFLMLLVSAIAAYFLLFPSQSVDFSQSLISASLYLSNVYFSSTINYLTPDPHLLPLLHTWSLSAEAQCYLIFPLILGFILNQKILKPVVAMGILLVILFILNLWLTAYNADVAFFSPSVRFYQFLCGAILVFIPSVWVVSKTFLHVCLLLGLVITGISFILLNRFIDYPGWLSLVPTLGSMLIIFSHRQGDLGLSFILNNKVMIYIGAISYSLYLWHWPVIVFYKTAVHPELVLGDYIFIVVLSLLLASLSRHFIEKKFNKPVYPGAAKQVFMPSVLATSILIGIGCSYLFSGGLKNRFSAEQLYFAQTDFSPQFNDNRPTDSCMVYKNRIESFIPENCIHISKEKSNMLLIGDSHAEHFRRAIEDEYKQISLSVATISGCRPGFPAKGRKTCVDMMEKVYSDLIQNNPFDSVLVSARWSLNEINNIPKAINMLTQYIENVIIVGPIISYPRSLPMLLARYGSDLQHYDLDEIRNWYERTRVIDERLKKISIDNGAVYISLLDLICPNSKCQRITENGVPLQWDYGHLTSEGALEIVRKFELQ